MSRVRKPFGGSSRGSGPPPPWWTSSPRPCGSGKAASRLADAGQLGRQIGELMGDEMDDLALALDAAAHGDHAGAQHDAAVFLEHLRPDHQVGDAGLVLDRDEHDALGDAGPLADQHEAGRLQPAPVAGVHRLGAGDDAARARDRRAGSATGCWRSVRPTWP